MVDHEKKIVSHDLSGSLDRDSAKQEKNIYKWFCCPQK